MSVNGWGIHIQIPAPLAAMAIVAVAFLLVAMFTPPGSSEQ